MIKRRVDDIWVNNDINLRSEGQIKVISSFSNALSLVSSLRLLLHETLLQIIQKFEISHLFR